MSPRSCGGPAACPCLRGGSDVAVPSLTWSSGCPQLPQTALSSSYPPVSTHASLQRYLLDTLLEVQQLWSPDVYLLILRDCQIASQRGCTNLNSHLLSNRSLLIS